MLFFFCFLKIQDDVNGSFRRATLAGNVGDSSENNPPPDPHMKISASQFIDNFDRGLAKRQSKGKYQVSLLRNFPKKNFQLFFLFWC